MRDKIPGLLESLPLECYFSILCNACAKWCGRASKTCISCFVPTKMQPLGHDSSLGLFSAGGGSLEPACVGTDCLRDEMQGLWIILGVMVSESFKFAESYF